MDGGALPQMCNSSASIAFNPTSKVVSGSGTLTCVNPAALAFKVCLEWKRGAEAFAEVKCLQANQAPEKTLSIVTESGGASSLGRTWRAVATGTLDGTALMQQVSSEILVP
jgi:hypothetical protein